ncbi:PucR family transcriptional regulator [Nocardia shimofusensis]|uniref:PucR family transcriptional regulator n=1 Tax=Nocardia shimofusensis TaxID=228596 RepID=UPI0027D78004|nr:helix-turn-helix domain-containing protein [Nocardia shimofusensis]
MSGEIMSITGTCLEIAVGMLDGGQIPEDTDRLAEAAAGWAREGVPIDTILHAIHEGFKLGTDLILASATAGDLDSVRSAVERMVELLDVMNTIVARSYIREHKAVVGEHHSAVHTLTCALLSGHPTSRIARESGLDVAGEYHVLALGIPKHPDESHPRLSGQVVARRKLRRVQSELARSGTDALSLLGVDGGTVLLPEPSASRDQIEALIGRLSAAAGVPVTGTLTLAPTAQIPEQVARAHELLDLVQRLQCEPRLYELSDVALEYQLSRPGPGRTSLAALLDPLDDHPELLETLQRHIANEFNRRRTARALHIHTNTVDYRLKRIAALTGIDPNGRRGLWQLRSALVAKAFADHAEPKPRTPAPGHPV